MSLSYIIFTNRWKLPKSSIIVRDIIFSSFPSKLDKQEQKEIEIQNIILDPDSLGKNEDVIENSIETIDKEESEVETQTTETDQEKITENEQNRMPQLGIPYMETNLEQPPESEEPTESEQPSETEQNNEIQEQKIENGKISTIGVEIYSDRSTKKPLSSIEWGALEPGTKKDIKCFVQNKGENPVKLNLETTSWNPFESTKHLTLTWDYDEQLLVTNEIKPLILTLSVSENIQGITHFTFDIIITGNPGNG